MAGKDVIQLYVQAPYNENGPYHLEKPLVALAAFEKTAPLSPGAQATVSLCWNARDIACYSDTAECYVLERGIYHFCVSAHANAAHTKPAAALCWELPEDLYFKADEITGTPYRNLFTGNPRDGYRYDARGTEAENIIYLHRTDIDGIPTVAPGTFPEIKLLDPITRETAQIPDLKTRGLSSYYEMDGTYVHLYADDVPVPTTNAVYRDKFGKQQNFSLQDVYRFLRDPDSPEYHNLQRLQATTGIAADTWDDALVWDHFLDQFSVNEMLCQFYHCGFDIPALKEYGIPVTYSADTPGQIGANNKLPMARTTSYCDTTLACTWNKPLCEAFGLALAQEAAASGENGTSWFYAPGNNLHRSCLSGKNNNYFSQDAHLAGWICGHFLKGLQRGHMNCCMKHFACNDQEISREGLVVFANEQTLRENYFAAFEHALKIGGGKAIMTSLGRVGTVNACGNAHLTVELLRKEWGFDGMLITDGYGVTSYMYDINVLLGANSGLLCFGNSSNLGECQDLMELYRYYLQYPGRTTLALRKFMQGSMNALMESHTFQDLYRNYNYDASEDAHSSTDVCWFDAQIGLGYTWQQAALLSYLGVKLQEGEQNPPSMMPNHNCKDRSGTIRTDDYGLLRETIAGKAGAILTIPISIQKSYGMSKLGFTVEFDPAVVEYICIESENSILTGYTFDAAPCSRGVQIQISTTGNVCAVPCGTLCGLLLKIRPEASPGTYPIHLLPLLDEAGQARGSFYDKQGHAMRVALGSQSDKYHFGVGWSGIYQDVESNGWQHMDASETEDLADITLLSNFLTVEA